ncbi:MAG: response regulator transcription factor [Bacteroidia bacterium]
MWQKKLQVSPYFADKYDGMIRVSIFEDNTQFREALSLLIGGTPGYSVTGSYGDPVNLEEKISESDPDVVIMDISMPGRDGIAAVEILRKYAPDIQILMLTVFEDEDRIFRALCAGASGYLLKNTSPSKLLESIREVSEGGAPMSPAIARKALGLLQKFGGKPDASAYDLTLRETEVLAQLVRGLSSKMIAAELNISYETVRSHLKSIYDKLHVASMTEAVSKALRENLI